MKRFQSKQLYLRKLSNLKVKGKFLEETEYYSLIH
jgi:hypothetical protein